MTDEDHPEKKFIEKRGHPRYTVNKNVRIEIDGEVVHGETGDISLGGIAVNSLVKLTTEQFVRLHLEKIGELTGEVVRELERGFAVEFETLEDNGSVLEDKLRAMMGNNNNDGKEQAGDDPAGERARMEAQLMAMLNGDDDD